MYTTLKRILAIVTIAATGALGYTTQHASGQAAGRAGTAHQLALLVHPCPLGSAPGFGFPCGPLPIIPLDHIRRLRA